MKKTATTPVPRDSHATKAAILAAARDRFANDGYERATIRAIAADARIDPALVMRYFGNKEQLFSAAAVFELRIPDLAAVPVEDLGVALARHFVQRWNSDDTFKALLRAAVTHEVAVARMQELLKHQLAPAVAKLIADPETAGLRAGLITSQVLGMALGRNVMLFPPLVALNKNQVALLMGPVFQAYLFGPLPQTKQTKGPA
ncbi:MAG: TetR family transcriptional regulator [Pseudoxanthomonas sp.]